ncbi:hypothetical protein QR680_007823 [Steinernema hermaphroditum]|uniref:SMP-LTD domain-containing protein n=1 Tax=Steinernema hermaphroditum TaxID=289476 RepID=A0AA39IGS5_9BILA|nr:hypothetical protein QR680_007823 [Steinernema hermaphroditum]
MATLREAKASLVDEAKMVADEFARCAILWHEQWHEAMEEASRLYFHEKNPKAMLAKLKPLHMMISQAQQQLTLKEQSFNTTYYNELKDALEHCEAAWMRHYYRTQQLIAANLGQVASPPETPSAPTTLQEAQTGPTPNRSSSDASPESPPSSESEKKPRKRFECPECGASVSRKFLLAGHMRIHTGEKPFATNCSGVSAMSFSRHRMALLGVLVTVTLKWPCFLLGVLWGFYLSFIGFLYFFVSEAAPQATPKEIPDDVMREISEECEKNDSNESHVLYKGWMNELRGRYSSFTYHVNQAQTVLVRLDGSMLRISRPERSVLKHSFHTDPTFTELEPKLVGQSIYDLKDAKVSLRPKRLAKRRWWSRKYPIYIRLASHENMTTVERKGSVALSGPSADRSVVEVLGVSDTEVAITDDIQDGREVDEGYDPEDSSDDEATDCPTLITRANSMGDLKTSASLPADHSTQRASSTKIYLFVRSAREKERWFHRLREACSQYRARPTAITDPFDLKDSLQSAHRNPTNKRTKTKLERTLSLPNEMDVSQCSTNLEYLQYMSNHLQFYRYLTDVVGTDSSEKSREEGTVIMDLGRNKWIQSEKPAPNDIAMAVNLLATRHVIFFDFCRDDYWCKAVRNQIQTKLATIRLPYFIETLELSSLDLGTKAPQIVGVYAPIVDQWGIWTDFEMKYEGGIRLVLETRVNLMKLKSSGTRVASTKKTALLSSSHLNRYSDEDIPESPESSADEDFGSKTRDDRNKTIKEKTGKRFLSFVDRLTQSKYFQEAAELKPVKKVMQGISSTQLRLNVEVTSLEGTMTFNIPPPPSDRLWYAFRKPPRISIRAIPQVGDRTVDMRTVSDWIEGKLRILLEKNFVCPNMDDIIVPVMSGNDLLSAGYNTALAEPPPILDSLFECRFARYLPDAPSRVLAESPPILTRFALQSPGEVVARCLPDAPSRALAESQPILTRFALQSPGGIVARCLPDAPSRALAESPPILTRFALQSPGGIVARYLPDAPSRALAELALMLTRFALQNPGEVVARCLPDAPSRALAESPPILTRFALQSPGGIVARYLPDAPSRALAELALMLTRFALQNPGEVVARCLPDAPSRALAESPPILTRFALQSPGGIVARYLPDAPSRALAKPPPMLAPLPFLSLGGVGADAHSTCPLQ